MLLQNISFICVSIDFSLYKNSSNFLGKEVTLTVPMITLGGPSQKTRGSVVCFPWDILLALRSDSAKTKLLALALQ